MGRELIQRWASPDSWNNSLKIRLETIVPIPKLNAVIRALLASHPYEEPAYDLATLTAPPAGHGQGRIGHISPTTGEKLIDHLKKELNLGALLFAGDAQRPINRVAVCAGAGGELLNAAIASKADLYLTGELRHHDALKAVQAGVNVICTLHSNCERPSLTRLKARLEQAVVNCPPVLLSQRDADPFAVR